MATPPPDNGAVREKTPLVAVIGASNELPEGEELDALFDRFLLRLHVVPVTKEAFSALLGLRGQATPEVPDELKLETHEIEAIQAAAEAVEVPEDVVALLCELRDWCTAEEIQVSDRRWRKVVKLLQVSAATNGRSRVSIWDCWLLQHCLWDSPEAREKVYEWYAARVGASAAMDPSRLTKIVVSWETRLKSDKDSRSQMRDDEGRPIFKSPDGKHTGGTGRPVQAKRDSEPLFLAPTDAYTEDRHTFGRMRHIPIADRTNGGKGYTRAELDDLSISDRNLGNLDFRHWPGRADYLANRNNWLTEDKHLTPVLEPTRHKKLYIEACVQELDQIREKVEGYQQQLLTHIETLEAEIREHLWVTPDFTEPAAQNLDGTRKEVETLLRRIAKLREGFESLPREAEPAPASSASEPNGTMDEEQ